MTDQITSQCPACGKRFRVSANDIGKKTKCRCGEPFVIQATKSNLPTLMNESVSKGTFRDKIVLEGTCPSCGETLKLAEGEIHAGQDVCPECKRPFAIAAEQIEAARQLRNEIESAKAQKESDRLARREEKEKLAEESQKQRVAAKQAAIAEQTAQLQRRETAYEQHVISSLRDLSSEAKTDGIKSTAEFFPNVPRALMLLTVFTYVISGLWLLLTVGLLGLGIYLLRIPGEEMILGWQCISFSLASAIGLTIFYIFAMAGIELYKMLMSVESQNRRSNALLATQIDVLQAFIHSKEI